MGTYHLAPHLSHETIGGIISDIDALDDSSIEIYWDYVQWVDIQEFSTLLAACGKLISKKKEINWIYLNAPNERLDNLRFHIEQTVGNKLYKRWTNSIRKILNDVKSKGVHPSAIYSCRRNIKEQLPNKHAISPKIIQLLEEWLELEFRKLHKALVVGYLERFNAFSIATACGINISSSFFDTGIAKYTEAEDTPILPFTLISNSIDIDRLLDTLSNKERLEEIFGNYTTLDVVERGIFSNILVSELSRNITEHSGAPFGWLFTALIPPASSKKDDANLLLKGNSPNKDGYLKIVISDYGRGLSESMSHIIKHDNRDSIASKYKTQKNDIFRDIDLIDYSFDRLSSSKRDISYLIHLDQDDEKDNLQYQMASSGLYWVWNTTKSHHGIIGIRSGEVFAKYDFTSTSNSLSIQEISNDTKWPGTQITILLPLISENERDILRNYSQPKYLPKQKGRNIAFFWIGNITTGHSLRAIDKTRSSLSPPSSIDSQALKTLHELQIEHAKLRSGDFLAIDLTGARAKWLKDNVKLLCHFFLEMNYSATSGESNVILCNVPTSQLGLFSEAFRDINSSRPQLSRFRKTSLLISDRDVISCVSFDVETQAIVDLFSYEYQLSISTLVTESRLPEQTIKAIISQNSHIFDYDPKSELVNTTISVEEIKRNARDSCSAWLEELANANTCDGGVKWEENGIYFCLPSTGHTVSRFYGYANILCNNDSLFRITWIFSEAIIRYCEKNEVDVQFIVSVTRSTKRLAKLITDNLSDKLNKVIRCITENTVLNLQDNSNLHQLEGNAIFITDVISSGTLYKQVAETLTNLNWISAFALLDCREDAKPDDTARINPKFQRFVYEVCSCYDNISTYAFSVRAEEKLDSDLIESRIVPIDKINVCPIFPPQRTDNALIDEPWQLISSSIDCLNVGHSVSGKHHYSVYINPAPLLDLASHQTTGKKFEDILVERVLKILVSDQFDPEKTIILHPPSELSYIDNFAAHIESETGSLYRHIISHERSSTELNFSPYLNPGIDLTGGTAIIIDDGANSGETLLSLIEGAAAMAPSRIIVMVGISRLPIHKQLFIHRIDTLNNGRTQVFFDYGISISIPSYSSHNCPMCSMKTSADRLFGSVVFLSRFMNRISSLYDVRLSVSLVDTAQKHMLIETGQIREAIELSIYDDTERRLLDELLTDILSQRGNLDKLNSLATIVFLEPHTIMLKGLIQVAPRILEQSLDSIYSYCDSETTIKLSSLIFHCLLAIKKHYSGNRIDSFITAVVSSYLTGVTRGPDEFNHSLPLSRSRDEAAGFFLGYIAIWLKSTNNTEELQDSSLYVAENISRTFLNQVTNYGQADDSSWVAIEAFSREILRLMNKPVFEQYQYLAADNDQDNSLVKLSKKVASSYWRHAATSLAIDLYYDPHTNLENQKPNLIINLTNQIVAYNSLDEFRLTLQDIGSYFTEFISERLSISNCMNDVDSVREIDNYGRMLYELHHILNSNNELENNRVSERVSEINQTLLCVAKRAESCLSSIFPSPLEACLIEWEDYLNLDLSSVVVKPIDESEEATKLRVFMPFELIRAFVRVCIENHSTHAFRELSENTHPHNMYETDLTLHSIKIKEKGQFVEIRITDNGPSINKDSDDLKGNNTALRNIDVAAKVFGGFVQHPHVLDDTTVVSLFMIERGVAK